MLYIVATPIGNLEDITLRALRILKEVDVILCKDTRVTRKLLDHYEIVHKKLISYHQHSKPKKVDEIIELIKNSNVALVTDAGTPGISDPGNKLISQAFEHSEVVPIPGPSAVTAALSIAGVPTDKFLFKGFIPHKKGREKFLTEVKKSKITTAFYESPHRIIKTLNSLNELNVKKDVIVCRELTKKFESVYRGSIGEVLEKVKNDPQKGEYVVIIH